MGFGFAYHDQNYDYVLMQTDDFSKTEFVLKEIMSRKLNLYYYYFFQSSHVYGTGAGFSYKTDVYILEDLYKNRIEVSAALLSGWRKK